MNIQELKSKTSENLISEAEKLGIENASTLRRQEIYFAILKKLLVIFLTIYHFYLGKILAQFKIDQNIHSHKYYRIINEIPTLLLILIVFVVVFKPL